MVTIVRAADLTVIGANGAGWLAPENTASPTDPTTTPASSWKGLGAISDDGLVFGFDEDQQQFTPWGLTSPFRTVVTKSVRTFKFSAWETNNVHVKSLWYRLPTSAFEENVGGFQAYAETASPSPDRRAFWFVVIDGDNYNGFYVPSGEVSDRSDVTFKQDEMAAFEFTVTAYPDASGNTVYHLDQAPTTPGGS